MEISDKTSRPLSKSSILTWFAYSGLILKQKICPRILYIVLELNNKQKCTEFCTLFFPVSSFTQRFVSGYYLLHIPVFKVY